MKKDVKKPKVVIVGGGFGGVRAAQTLGNKAVNVTLIDRTNHFIFQPLLYQVATAVLSPGEVAVPIRRVLHRYKNTEVVLGEVVGFDNEKRLVKLEDGAEIEFDYLIVAAGARHSYFGHDEWEKDAPGLKTVEDAVEIRRRVLLAFELAEREAILTGKHQPLVFAVVGGGPTGVELAGAIAGIAKQALEKDFKAIDTKKTRVLLFEGSPEVLGTFAADLSKSAERQLRDLGVEVFLNSFVTRVEPNHIKVGDQWIECSVALWATGVMASGLSEALGAETDRAGRVLVEPDLSIPAYKNIFVIGDMAFLKDASGTTVPGLSPAAIQEGEHAAKNILGDLHGKPRRAFRYVNRGTMATIGRNKAIAEFGDWHFSGFVAWLMWVFVHIVLLINFRSRFAVLSEWVWAYFTRERSARLIVGNAAELARVKKSPEKAIAENGTASKMRITTKSGLL
ncbi:MAG TPA: NAD(P)/FAD-dependent oxidoreductase [Pyrinomonadaceae bacterium]|jgi:NADH dehydrogenase